MWRTRCLRRRMKLLLAGILVLFFLLFIGSINLNVTILLKRHYDAVAKEQLMAARRSSSLSRQAIDRVPPQKEPYFVVDHAASYSEEDRETSGNSVLRQDRGWNGNRAHMKQVRESEFLRAWAKQTNLLQKVKDSFKPNGVRNATSGKTLEKKATLSFHKSHEKSVNILSAYSTSVGNRQAELFSHEEDNVPKLLREISKGKNHSHIMDSSKTTTAQFHEIQILKPPKLFEQQESDSGVPKHIHTKQTSNAFKENLKSSADKVPVAVLKHAIGVGNSRYAKIYDSTRPLLQNGTPVKQKKNETIYANGTLINMKGKGLLNSLNYKQNFKDKKFNYGFVSSDIDTKVFEVSKTETYLDVQLPPFRAYGKPGDPGELGVGYRYLLKNLTPEQKKQKDAEYKIHYFDVWTSNKISVRRTLQDGRLAQCKNQSLPELPRVSVLVVFHNEAWSTLLRTIHSILDRTPAQALAELILLDDLSNLSHLGDPLASYVNPLDKVRLLRATERLGLIKARNTVFQHATGEVVVFLDSHVECFPGWLEHLVAPIVEDYRIVTFPVIEIIDSRTFRVVESARPTAVGGLDIKSLNFRWLVSRSVAAAKHGDNIPSPTMPGGLYAVSRRWFSELGQYDAGLALWGGENIEMSFKTWMCGGKLLQVSCSHVGHIFRSTNPAFKESRNFNPGYKNSVRVAEVWMDHFKHFFYEKIAYRIADFGDVSGRVKLRNSLKCHRFSWYLDNVFPELKKDMDLNSIYSGPISNAATRQCMDRSDDQSVRLHKCRPRYIYQFWQLSSDGRLVSGDRAVGVLMRKGMGRSRPRLGLFKTFNKNLDVEFQFRYDQRYRLVHEASQLCLHAESGAHNVVLTTCSPSTLTQRWHLKTRTDLHGYLRKKGIPIDWSV